MQWHDYRSLKMTAARGGSNRESDCRDPSVNSQHRHANNRLTRPLQPTCYPYDYSIVNEDGKLFDGSSRQGNARTRWTWAAEAATGFCGEGPCCNGPCCNGPCCIRSCCDELRASVETATAASTHRQADHDECICMSPACLIAAPTCPGRAPARGSCCAPRP